MHELMRELDRCMVADARRLHARIRGLRRPSHHNATTAPDGRDLLGEIAHAVERSKARVEARRAAIPGINYPDLPVAARREEIMAAIRDHQVVVVCGATGSGKTTQLPKMLLELRRGTRGWIGHTQPRRIAARSVGARIASELGTRLGELVGFKVRFTDQTSERSLVKLMTDGILLAETQHDRYLSQYDTIVIDEAHERSLNIDFLIGYLRQLLPRRPDLKVVITSATIDPKSFADHFTQAGAKVPVIEVSGRTYPVEMRYRPLEAQHPDEDDLDQEQGILHAVDELSQGVDHDPTGGGDILVFLPGEREIRETAEALRKHPLKPAHRVDVIPLYARLSNDEQQRVFDPPPGRRRIILATNVAETSLTVPGIKYVIDAGVARISRYSPRIKVQRLPIEKVSRASANQRSGRCGRTSPGVCIRLYSEDDFNARPEFTDPEILRTNLASVILQMKALDLGDIEDFPFLQPPGVQSIRDGYDTLLEINALESGGLRMDLTSIGRQLARLPIDPRIGRMLLAADVERSIPEVLVIAAALSTQDPRERPMEKQAEADAAHVIFREEGSDFLGQLKLWRELHKQQKHLSGSQFRKWCREKFVSYLRFREWHDTHVQIRELLADMGYKVDAAKSHAKPEAIHRALLTGLLSSIGQKNDKSQRDVALGEGDYDGARGIKFNIFPGSVLFKKTPKWVMASEIVKTTRTYARTAASISPQWIEALAQHLVKRTYADPHWDTERAEAVVYESQTLYGLEIVKRRRVALAPIDPGASRALFIQHALVGGEYLTNAKFFEHNHTLTRHMKHLQEKARVNDLIADQASQFAFFDKRLPSDVATGNQFEHWRRRAESREPTLLMMKKEDVLARGAVEPPAEQYPESMCMHAGSGAAEHRFQLEYKFDTGANDDGITIIVPIDRVGEVTQQRIDWLVPGLVRPRIEALLRELPKSLRASFVPIPQTAEAAAARMPFAQGDFIDSLTRALREATNIFVAREHWHPDRLARHLVMNIRVIDPRKHGKPVMSGRDLAQIRREFAGQAEASLVRLPDGPGNRSGVFHWDFGPISESVDIQHDGRTITVYPALNDERGTEDVAIRPFTSLDKAAPAHAAGLRRLFFLHTRRECRSLIETTPGIEKMKLLHAALVAADYVSDSGRGIVEDLAELTAHRAWEELGAKDIRSKEAFEERLNRAWTRIGTGGAEVFTLAERLLKEHLAFASLYAAAQERPEWGAAALDQRVQLAYLFAAGFWTRTPWEWLRQYPRYLGSARRRLDRLAGIDGTTRDTRLLNEIAPWVTKLRIRVEQGTPSERADPNLVLFRWMLEEWRVALWGDAGGRQETVLPVSARRIEEQWARVTAINGQPAA
jgi:ATP-dependent helicase HrpA